MASAAGRWCLLVAATVCAAPAPPGAPQAADPVATYRHAVDSYRAGHRPGDRDADQIPDPSTIVEAIAAPASGWTADDLAAAAMMHTDTSLSLLKGNRPADARVHIENAARLLEAALARDPSRAGWARRWSIAVAGLLHAFGAPDMSSSLRARTATWLPESPEQSRARAAFEKGVTLEIQAAVAGPLSGPMPKRTAVVPAEALATLGRAAQEYETAMYGDPAYAEAALHLGRIRLLAGHDTEAERWLQLAAGGQTRAVRYLAQMFLGAARERQGRYADAEAHYRSALDTFRWGQSAPLALSHLLMRTGRESEARQALATYFAAIGDRSVEPLWTYLADPATDLGPTLDELRAEVWR